MRLTNRSRNEPAPATESRVLPGHARAFVLPMLPLVPGSPVYPFHLLTAKLQIPHSRRNIVPRPRLNLRLDTAFQYPLTLVSAPAGFGKTTLLAQWARQREGPVAWVSLSRSDNAPIHFWAYFMAALQNLSDLGDEALSLLRTFGEQDIESFLIAVLNQIHTLENPSLLVLDDYHTIEADAIHQAMAFLLEHLPEQMHFVIATRTAPPLPLARLRERGQLAELFMTDLSFSPEECADLFTRVGSVSLSPQEISLLHTKTEGWVGALSLVALSLASQPNPSQVIARLTGSDRLIADYLTEEVLGLQSPDLQDFMLKTSILDRLCAPLCDAVLGPDKRDSQERLEALERANLFLIALDRERQWYRYHPLFADLLRDQLQKNHPNLTSDLYRRASLWYEQNGGCDEAIQMALAGQDFGRAVVLIKANRDAMTMRSDMNTLLRWVEALPAETIRSHPRLSLAKARSLVPLGRVQEAEACLQDTEATIHSDASSEQAAYGARSIRGEVAAIRALIAISQSDANRIIANSHQALEFLPPDHLFLRGLVSLSMGVAYLLTADLPHARQALDEAVNIHLAAGNVLLTYLSKYYLAEAASLEGKWHAAAEISREALEIARTESGRELPIASLAHIALARCLYKWNDLEGAIQHASLGLELSQGWWVRDAVHEANLTLALALEARGDLNAALAAHRQACQLWNGKFDSPFAGHAGIASLRLWARAEDLSPQFEWAEGLERAFHPDGDLTPAKGREMLAAANLLLVEGKLDPAARLLEPLPRTLEAHGLVRQLIQVHILRALVYSAQGNPGRALLALNPALALAEPEGLVRVFVDQGAPMLALLRQAQRRGIAPAFVDRLLAAFGQPTRDTPVGAPSLVEPLSKRELEILRLIAHGLSTQEAAQQLMLTVGTVRKHVEHIHSKLRVHSRLQAVERARALRLL